MSEKCPKCGARVAFRVGETWVEYRCLSIDRDGVFEQGMPCVIALQKRIIVQLLAACRDALNPECTYEDTENLIKDAIAAAEAAGCGKADAERGATIGEVCEAIDALESRANGQATRIEARVQANHRCTITWKTPYGVHSEETINAALALLRLESLYRPAPSPPEPAELCVTAAAASDRLNREIDERIDRLPPKPAVRYGPHDWDGGGFCTRCGGSRQDEMLPPVCQGNPLPEKPAPDLASSVMVAQAESKHAWTGGWNTYCTRGVLYATAGREERC